MSRLFVSFMGINRGGGGVEEGGFTPLEEPQNQLKYKEEKENQDMDGSY